MRVQRCKGTRDLSPEDMRAFRFMESVFRDCCLKWGYEEIKTPTLEYLYLFTSAGTLTPGMLSKVYSFLDWDGWSGERVVLRPDVTIPVARLYTESMPEKELAKLFYITNTFIFEETGKETRERWQCGAELIGAGSTSADVELMIMALEALQRLELKNVELRLSHAGLIKALLAKLGLSMEEQVRIFDQILDGDTEALTRVKPEEPELGKTLSLLLDQKGESPGFLKNLMTVFNRHLPELESPLNNFITIAEVLEASGYKFSIDIASGRGFEYYTGVIFQLFAGEEKIGGGGRYDALIPLMGGKDIPASGFALYLDHLMNQVKPKTQAEAMVPKVLIRSDQSEIKGSFNVVKRLHESGYTAETYLDGHNQADFRWVLNVRSKSPRFILSDQFENKEFKAQTSDEVIELLGEKGADKDSAT